jgi:hypothetical protein
MHSVNLAKDQTTHFRKSDPQSSDIRPSYEQRPPDAEKRTLRRPASLDGFLGLGAD